MSSEYGEFFEEFMEESRDHLNTMNLSLLEIEKEKSAPSKEHIDNLFRAAHTVKGLSGMMEFASVEALCHAVEDMMDLVRSDRFTLNDASFQVLFRSLDILEVLLNELAEDKTTETSVDDVIADIKNCLASDSASSSEKEETETVSEAPKVAVDFDYNFDEFTISEIEKIKIEQAVKDDRFIYEVAVELEGGTPLEDLEESPFIETFSELGSILLFSPPLREIEAANQTTIRTIVLVATPLDEEALCSEISEDFEMIRRGKEMAPLPVEKKTPEPEADVPPPPPPPVVLKEEPAKETVLPQSSSFCEVDYSNVAFCDDVTLVDTEILEGYNADVEELVESLDLALIDLENSPEDMDTINSVFRVAHTIKGTSAMFGFSRIVELTHKLENLFDDVRKEKIKVNANIMDIVFAAVDKLRVCLDEIKDMEDKGVNISSEVNSIARFMGGYSETPSTLHDTKESEASPNIKEGFAVPGFTLSDTSSRIITEGFAKGHKLYTLGISFKDDVMASSFDPMNIFMILEMVGDLVASVLDISHVPDFEHFDSEKFYLKYKYLILSDQSEQEIRDTLSAMEQVIIDSLEEASIGAVASVPEEKVAKQQVAPEPEEAPAPKKEVPKAIVPKKELPSPAPARKVQSQTTQAPKSSAPQKEQEQGKAATKSSATIRVDIERLDKLLNLVGEFVIDRTRYTQIGEDIKRDYPHSPHAKMLSETNMLFGRHMNEIQDVIMSVRMVPIGNAFNKFPRVVRDLARSLQKEIDLVLFGEETELDKTLVEEIGDPLVHLVRNSVDHGIEMPDVREAQGKPRNGTIKMSAFQEGSNIVIEIQDDGGGMNKHKILQKAVERGLVEEGVPLTDKEIFNLIFEPGFSTADVVSNVSGRGVGMDVVKRNIEKLKGIIDIESEMGVGSTITIKLPLTLAIVQTLIVCCGTEHLAIPLSSVIETVRIEPEEIKILQGKEMINLRNNVLPLMSLREFYGYEPAERSEIVTKGRKNKRKRLFVVIVGLAEKRLGLIVDSLKTQQEIVIKSIGKLLNNALGISGGTIMGNGNVVLIVDVAEVINNSDRVKTRITGTRREADDVAAKTILLCNKSQHLQKRVKEALKGYDLVTSRSEDDIAKKLNYYNIDLVIAEHHGKHEIDWRGIMKAHAKNKNTPIIYLTSGSTEQKKTQNQKSTMYFPETIDDNSLLECVNKLL